MKKYNVYGKGGGGGGSSEPYIPVEEENTLTSTTTARIVDLLGEGEIYQPAVDNNWYKSTYFNEVPVMNDNGELNFEGVTISAKHGTETQDYLKGFDAVENFFTVNTELTYNTPIIRTLSDTDIDDVKITISVPRLFIQEDDGDIRKNKVTYQVTITPDNGAGSEVSVISSNDSGVIEGKCITEYRKQHIIENISQYGNAPWVIKVYKSTEDSESLKDLRNISWYSYTTVKNVKIAYRNRAVVGVTLDAKKFNNQIPYRAYHVKGRLIKYPSNYNPTSRKYTGTWDGTWTTGYTNCPAWILNDILSSKRFGAGLTENQISKWSLYSIAQYCDETVSYKEAIRGADGKYVETTKYEPRFTFNGVIGSRAEALAVVNHLCSVFRGFPIYTTGMIGFIQDSPRDVSRVANPSNVIDGLFEYEGVPMQLRHTAAKVSWNNPEIFGRLDVLVVEDEDGIAKYGYNPIDITCFGCTSKSEAIRRAKYILYTDINQTESVSFQAGLDFADCIPGEIVSVQDPNYADVVLSGRVASGTTTSITIDREIELEDGIEYTLRVQTRWYDVSSASYKDIKEVTLTNNTGTTNTLTWSGAFDEAPETDAVWVLSSSSVATREFIVMRVSETDNTQFTIQGIEYDPLKYELVESNIKYDATPDTTLDSGVLDPPSNIELQPYSYTESDQSVRKYGLVIGWTASPDVRTTYYEVRYKRNDGAWISLDKTGETTYDWKGVEAGTYDISVRAKGITGASVWVTYADFVMVTALSGPAAVTNLQVAGGGTTFSGADCHIEWTGSAGADYDDGDIGGGGDVGDSNVKNYKIEVYKVDDTLLRTAFTDSKNVTEYTYNYEANKSDNDGSPVRQIKFKVYTQDIFDELSTGVVLVANNPAPDMSSASPNVTAKYGYLKVDWTLANDNDMELYKVYCDTSNPPTTLIDTVIHPNNISEVHGLEYGTNYYVMVTPYDKFGAGSSTNIPAPVSPLEIPDINIQGELTASITMSDSKGNNIATLAKLYDGQFNGNGVSYTVTSEDYVEYKYGIEDYFDRVGIWVSNSNAQAYIAYSTDGSTWNYLKARADHSLASGELVAASNQADAQTNYWSLDSGKNIALLPNNTVAKYIRLYLYGSFTTEVWEFVPSRILISELAAIQDLSAISADIGTIQAGNLQSSDYSPSAGMNIDMDSRRIYLGGSDSPSLYFDSETNTLNIDAIVTFRSGSSSTNLDVEWDSVTGTGKPEDNATDNSNWEHVNDVTTIDGGWLNVGSKISLQEGGSATFGDGNVIIDTSGNHGSIVVAEDGGPATGDYCELSDGDINFWRLFGSTHIQAKSLKNVQAGVANSGGWVNIPGYFKSPPTIMVSPNKMEVYSPTYKTQGQSIRYFVDKIEQYSTGRWRFLPKAELILTSGSTGGIVVNKTVTLADAGDRTSANVTMPANTRKITATAKVKCWKLAYYSQVCLSWSDGGSRDGTCLSYGYRGTFYKTNGTMKLQCYVSGAWKNAATQALTDVYKTDVSVTLSSPTYSADIKYYRWIWDYTGTGSTNVVTAASLGTTKYTSLTNVSYSANQTGLSVVKTGSVNWIAVGE